MRKTYLVIAHAISLALLVTPLVSWGEIHNTPFNGAYIGVDIGRAWGSATYNTDPGCAPDTDGGTFCNAPPAASATNGTAVAYSGSGKLKLSGLNIGGHLGYNWSTKGIVLGAEADYGALNFDNSTTANGVFPFPFLGTIYTLHDSASANWVATLRGRIGPAIKPSFLIYATGGVAFTSINTSSSYNDNAVSDLFPGGAGRASESNSRTGWTVGGGAEWQFNHLLSVKAEYLYMDFGSVNLTLPVSNTAEFSQTMHFKTDFTTSLVRLGVNYQF